MGLRRLAAGGRMGTLWAYRRIIGVGIAVAAAFAFYILVIAPAVFAPGARRPTSAAIAGLVPNPPNRAVAAPAVAAA